MFALLVIIREITHIWPLFDILANFSDHVPSIQFGNINLSQNYHPTRHSNSIAQSLHQKYLAFSRVGMDVSSSLTCETATKTRFPGNLTELGYYVTPRSELPPLWARSSARGLSSVSG